MARDYEVVGMLFNMAEELNKFSLIDEILATPCPEESVANLLIFAARMGYEKVFNYLLSQPKCVMAITTQVIQSLEQINPELVQQVQIQQQKFSQEIQNSFYQNPQQSIQLILEQLSNEIEYITAYKNGQDVINNKTSYLEAIKILLNKCMDIAMMESFMYQFFNDVDRESRENLIKVFPDIFGLLNIDIEKFRTAMQKMKQECEAIMQEKNYLKNAMSVPIVNLIINELGQVILENSTISLTQSQLLEQVINALKESYIKLTSISSGSYLTLFVTEIVNLIKNLFNNKFNTALQLNTQAEVDVSSLVAHSLNSLTLENSQLTTSSGYSFMHSPLAAAGKQRSEQFFQLKAALERNDILFFINNITQEMAQQIEPQTGNSLLHYAIGAKNIKAASTLISLHHNFHVQNAQGRMPLDYLEIDTDDPNHTFLWGMHSLLGSYFPSSLLQKMSATLSARPRHF